MKNIVARASLDSISIRENYSLYTTFPVFQLTDENKGRGEIKIILPFDGKSYVNKQSIEDIRNQLFGSSLKKIGKAIVGYLGFSGYENTNLDDLFSLSLRHNLLPITLNFSEKDISDPKIFFNDLFEQISFASYIPTEIKRSPIYFNRIEIRDEFDVVNIPNRDEITKFLTEDWNKRENKLASFDPNLVFLFHIKFDVPNRLRSYFEENPPVVSEMKIEWPIATSVNHVEVSLQTSDSHEENEFSKIYSNRDVRYDPRSQLIRWENVPFQQEPKGDGNIEFLTPVIKMAVREPGELYEQEKLKGEFIVKFPSLYSGLGLFFYDASGKRNDSISFDFLTEMKVKFEFDLLKGLERKIYTPYQMIKFPKVVLDRMRVNDIVTLLRDKRFDVYTDMNKFPDSKVGKVPITFSIIAQREEGDNTLMLIIDLEGKPSSTEREKEIPEGEKFKSTFSTGETTCYIRGRLPNDPQIVVQEINDIHALLKHRFRHVSVLD